MSNSQSHNEKKLSNLPDLKQYFTGHDASTGKSLVQEARTANWRPFDNNQVSMHEVFITSKFPPDLSNDEDIATNDKIQANGDLGLVQDGGTVCRIVDFAPQNEPMMHQTESLDYGIVLEGTIKMVMDDGQVTSLRRGEVAVQRATMHGWKNPSKTEWARMVFFMQHCQPSTTGDCAIGEELEN